MLNLKKLLPLLILTSISGAAFATPAGVTAFSITPLSTQATVQSIGQTSVQYTIANNSTASIPNINITPNWNSTGINLSLSNDNCSSQTLSSGGTCTFDITIPGTNQPSSFSLQPKVCGFNGQICSQAASTVSVDVTQRTLPIRAYEVIFTPFFGTEKLVGININDTSDIIEANISTPNSDGPLAISPDGSKVYITHNNGDNTYRFLVFDVTSNSLTQDDTSYSLSYGGKNLGFPGQIAISPDGETAYITDNSFPGIGYPVYKVDLSSDTPASAVTGISDDTTGGVATRPRAIALSPDGQTVYFANASTDIINIFSFPNLPSTTSVSTIAHETDLTNITALLISSDGSTLYAAGQATTLSLPATIEQYNISNNFSVENTFLPTPDTNGNIVATAISPDDTKIYTTLTRLGTYYLYSVNTATMTAPAGASTFPYSVIFGVFNTPYLAYSPDGSAVAITNYGDSGNLTAFFDPDNPFDPDDVTTVSPGGETSMYSYTRKSFIN